jgi:DnaJ-class molecular chaperone
VSTFLRMPAHEPCGDSVGELVRPTTLKCAEIRRFRRCTCKPDPDNPSRGSKKCPDCHGVGHLIMGRRPGCGRVVRTCPTCGCPTCWDGSPCTTCNPKETHAIPNET